jgi:hypothetical protein
MFMKSMRSLCYMISQLNRDLCFCEPVSSVNEAVNITPYFGTFSFVSLVVSSSTPSEQQLSSIAANGMAVYVSDFSGIELDGRQTDGS